MTETCGACETIYRCTLCETKFEAGVADDMDGGPPRCPQCGLLEAEPVPEDELDDDLVIRRMTKFR